MQFSPKQNEVGKGTVLQQESNIDSRHEDFDVYSGFDQIEDDYNKPEPIVAEVEKEVPIKPSDISFGSTVTPIGNEVVVDEGISTEVNTLNMDSTKQIVDSKDFQWGEVLSPDSDDFKRKQRRDFWSTFLTTGSTTDAFKASYEKEDSAKERYIRNQNKQHFLDQGYTAESVQSFIMSGNQKELDKHEELDLNEALHGDGKVYMTDKYGRPYGLPLRKGKQDVQIIQNPDGSNSSYARDPITGKAVLKRLNEPVSMMTKEQAKIEAVKAKQEEGVKTDAAVLYSSAGDQLQTIDRLLSNESGRKSSVGYVDSKFPTFAEDASKFEADHRQLMSQQFMTNIENLKGMGALSDTEGKKVQDLIASLELDMNQTTYNNKLKELRDYMVKAQERAKWIEANGRKPSIAEIDQLERASSVNKTKSSDGLSREDLLNKY